MRLTVSQWVCNLNRRITDLESSPSTGQASLSGSAPPSNAIGKDGDSYLQFSGGKLYKKINGTWILQGTIELDVDGGIV